MKDCYDNMLRRDIAIDWDKDEGPVDLRYHSAGIGGVHSMPAPLAVVDAVAALKPRLIRIFLQEFFYVYPDHGVYDWSKMDAYMEAVHAMGGDIMASICIKPKVLYPELDESVWMPNNAPEWRELIRAMAVRYSVEKPYVTHWAIANEMNIGEWGGCPYLIKNPDDYYEYYKMTAEPIREAAPGVKVGGPSHAGGGKEAAAYLARFVQLCKENNTAVDFTCYNEYSDSPERHTADGRAIRDAIDRIDPNIKLYITEFNIGIGEELSLEEKVYESKCAASLAASILSLHEDGCLDGSFQYHIYDQFNDPREFAPWFSRARYMAEHWNDKAHRLGLLDLDGKAKPQYFVYQLLYSVDGSRANLKGADNVLRGLAARGADGVMSVFMSNFALHGTPDAVLQFHFENAEAGIYRLNVYRIDSESAAAMKASPMRALPPAESRVVYVHPDFHFDVFAPADSVILVRLERQPV